MIRSKLLPIAIASLLAAGLVATGCGGEDPEQVLEDASAASSELDSGVIDVTAEASADVGSVDVALSGPFQAGEEGVPEFDISATVAGEALGQSFEGFEGGAVSTGDAGYVDYQGTFYELDRVSFQQLARALEIARAAQPAADEEDFSTAGLTDLENEGDEDVEGVETTHISGSIDPEALPEPTSGAVEEGSFDVYVGKDDDIIRRIESSTTINTSDLTSAFAPTAPEVGTATFDLVLTFSEVNEPQTIEVPADAEPADKLFEELGLGGFGLGALGGLGGLGGGAGGDSGDSFDFDGPGGVEPGGGGEGGSDAYFECIESASPDEVADCVNELQ